MDDLTLLRGYDRDVAAPKEDVLARSRGALDARMRSSLDTASPASRRERLLPLRLLGARRPEGAARTPGRAVLSRRVALVGIGVLAATCTAVTLFATGPAPQASAAETLRAAAAAVGTTHSLGRGVRTHALRFAMSSSDRYPDGSVSDESVLIEQTKTLRPVGNGSDWVSTYGGVHLLKAWGPHPEQLAATTRRELRDEAREIGKPVHSKSDPDFWGGTTPAQARAMPRDPKVLLEKLSTTKSEFSGKQTRTQQAIYAAYDLLGSGLADAGLQAATYRALELLPDLEARPGKDIDGRHGVVITATSTNGHYDTELIIDPATGAFLGVTAVDRRARSGAPAGTVDFAASYYFGG